MEKILEEYRKRYGYNLFLNNHASVGIIEISRGKEEPWYWFETKVEGYPAKNFVGAYCLIGGSWIYEKDKTPLDVYGTEIGEEIRSEEIVKTLLDNTKPIADYFSHSPGEVHGNPKQCDFNFICSLFKSEIDEMQLAEFLGLDDTVSIENLSKKLFQIQEFPPAVLKLSDFKVDLEKQFCWGYDQLLSEYLKKSYGFQPKLNMVKGVVIKKLNTSPLAPLEERETQKYCRVNPLREHVVDDSVIFET